jgi:hypothetical protein
VSWSAAAATYFYFLLHTIFFHFFIEPRRLLVCSSATYVRSYMYECTQLKLLVERAFMAYVYSQGERIHLRVNARYVHIYTMCARS